jgi:hypothetical protein
VTPPDKNRRMVPEGAQQNVKLIENETWLPRTKSLLDMANHVHIPAGVTQVAPPK